MKWSLYLIVCAVVCVTSNDLWGQGHRGPACVAVDEAFRESVWEKVGQRVCLNCHQATGDAADSRFLLIDPARQQVAARARALASNHAAFRTFALEGPIEESRLLRKVIGELDHGGGQVVKPDSGEFKVLKAFILRERQMAGGAAQHSNAQPTVPATPFFAGVQMLEPERLLRRVTLQLAGRLPTPEEIKQLEQQGPAGLDQILDRVLEEPAFYERLEEGFNDIFLMFGYDGVPERVLGYRNFGKTRHWNQAVKFEEIEDEKQRRQATYKLADKYREAMLAEPYQLIRHIVRNDLPFTQIVTADYIMVSPYTARGYGIYDDIKDQFKDPGDHMEFIPAKLPALTRRDGKPDQESESGLYPHAGLLSTFHWLKRYPTTETNRNRLRARMYFQHFLGIDIMTLAPRVSDAAAVDAKYDVPTMQAADCVVCHQVIDPIAGLFQDYYDTSAGMDFGPYSPRQEGWFEDMFPPGSEGAGLPADQRWRPLQWLGERTANDPRFAVAMVEHVYYILSGRKVLIPPQNIDDPLFDARRRAYREQRNEVERIAAIFAEREFNLKEVFKAWMTSRFYRADGIAEALADPQRTAELADVGVVRLLTPEQLDRKIVAIFGKPWKGFNESLRTLYGAIDSKEITERLAEPSGAIGAVQRIMSNEVACQNVAADFALASDQRRLFPKIDPDVVPGSSAEADQQIRQAMAHLHRLLLGSNDAPNSESVDQTFELFHAIVIDAQERKGIAPLESYFCKSTAGEGKRDADPHYTIRAWRAVVTYLLRQDAFLYE